MKLPSLLIAIALSAFTIAAAEPAARPRILVLTDLSNEPDDEESLVRFLVYSNEFDVEGLVATTSVHLKKGTREDILHRDIDAYGQVVGNLSKHAPGYPSAEHLHSVCRTGQPAYGMDAVGPGKSTPGSQRIIEVVDAADERPVWVTIWGGANTLAQALRDVQDTRDAAAVDKFIAKLRIYAISDQDDGGHWIRPTFPKLFYICSPGTIGGGDYWNSTWCGISGDRLNRIGVMHRFAMVDNPWLAEHIHAKGPLGALYPPLKFLMEGDTPSWLGLVDNGLGWSVRPDYGGWGGRYQEWQPWGESRKLWTGGFAARDTVTSDDNGRTETSVHATIWRWREAFQNDFSARMDWTLTDDFKQANHNPVAVLNGDRTKRVLELTAKPGETLPLSAEGTSDPDDNAVETKWWIYPEASTPRDRWGNLPEGLKLTADHGATTSLVVPPGLKSGTVHVILEARDDGTPNLWAYRRAVVKIEP